MASLTPPDPEVILALVAACDCSRETAITLLQDNCNDFEQAKSQHSILKRYFGNIVPARSRSRTSGGYSPYQPPITYPSHSISDESSDDDEADESELIELVVPNTGRWNLGTKTAMHVEEQSGSLPTSSKLTFKSVTGSDVNVASLSTTTTKVKQGSLPESSDFQATGTDLSSNGELEEWDFQLPTLSVSVNDDDGGPVLDENASSFDPSAFATAIQRGFHKESLLKYLDQWSDVMIGRINDEIEGCPLMFYVVQSNNEPLFRKVIEKGGNPEAVHGPSQIPLLAFAIVNSQTAGGDKTLLVATLLSLGASASGIPSKFYTPYLRDLPENGPADPTNLEKAEGTLSAAWCTEDVSRRLASAMTLSHRYYLEKAATLRKPTPREIDLAQRRNAEGLLGVPYFLIGQSLAAHLLLRKLLSHVLSPSKRPLVMVFAGPSGHGKTQLARQLGHLLSLNLKVVDCTVVSREMELFGPREPYMGAEKGSQLNNFLAEHHGQRCIVFLDEFEKTTPDIHKTLLLPFDNGEYQDRRHNTSVNCSKTIWILATNAHDKIIQDYYEAHEECLAGSEDKDESVRLIKNLSSEVKDDFLSKFGPPLTGRISAFIPFLPFSAGEQAVIVHKYLMELGESVEGPVNLSRGPDENLLGNVKLCIRKDASVCKVLAQSGYSTHLGARSLLTAVDTVKSRLVDEYLEINEGFSENPVKTDCFVDVRGGEIVVKMTTPK